MIFGFRLLRLTLFILLAPALFLPDCGRESGTSRQEATSATGKLNSGVVQSYPSEPAPIDAHPPSAQSGTLVRVADGDTFEFKLSDGRQVRVRMFGVDAPEWKQQWGRNSADCLHDLLSRDDLSIVEKYKDPYERSVAIVYSGTNDVNRALVERGCAWAFRRYSTQYVNSETKAREARRGLWRSTNPQAPWEWRRTNR